MQSAQSISGKWPPRTTILSCLGVCYIPWAKFTYTIQVFTKYLFFQVPGIPCLGPSLDHKVFWLKSCNYDLTCYVYNSTLFVKPCNSIFQKYFQFRNGCFTVWIWKTSLYIFFTDVQTFSILCAAHSWLNQSKKDHEHHYRCQTPCILLYGNWQHIDKLWMKDENIFPEIRDSEKKSSKTPQSLPLYLDKAPNDSKSDVCFAQAGCVSHLSYPDNNTLYDFFLFFLMRFMVILQYFSVYKLRFEINI